MNLEDIRRARNAIHQDIYRTPLIQVPCSLPELDGRLYLKCENFQKTRSFKSRGAYTVLRNLDSNVNAVVTRSSGNFAQAVSEAATSLSVAATIVMPTIAPVTKLERTKAFGATVIEFGETPPEGDAKAREIAEETGAVLLSPYDNEHVIAGQGTIALEVCEEIPEPGLIVAPIGGGGLLGGISLGMKSLSGRTRVWGVEPEGANDYVLSRASGTRTPKEHIATIADGLRTACVGELNWPLLQEYVDDVYCVSDEQIIDAMRWLYREVGLVIEPSGAASLASVFARVSEIPATGSVVCVISGGNVDEESFRGWICSGRQCDMLFREGNALCCRH